MTFQYYQMANYTIFHKLLLKRLEGSGLTPGQPKILDYLADHNGSAQTKIAAACYIEPASLTSLLNGMESKGLIERKRIDGNRRSYFIYLTAAGEEKASLVQQTFTKLEDEVLKRLDKECAARITNELAEVHMALTYLAEREASSNE